MNRLLSASIAILVFSPALSAQEAELSVGEQRLMLMKARVADITFSSEDDSFPEHLHPVPLFRYDDLPRGYIDGTVWRLRETGRPSVIVTTELHPNFFGAGSKIIYEFLSLTDELFRASSNDFPSWQPRGTGLTLKPLPDGLEPAASSVRRQFQIKSLLERFDAKQVVEGEDLVLRRLPQAITTYKLEQNDRSDGAAFLFVAGRMPAVVLLIETDGETWHYGLGRLSRPSELIVRLDEAVVWQVDPSPRSWTLPFTSTNAPAVIPE